jgi:ATP-dependent protease ClpP protease subunit
MPKFWNFIKNAATETEPESIELRIEGDIVSDDDAWFYEWFGIPIPVTSPNAFRSELAQYAGRDIVVWIDSYGGDVFAATGIYTALMEHKKKGAKIICKTIKAMSAATLPFMAGDERLMTPPAVYMMHNPLTGAYGYASDLRKTADVLDVVKEAIINAYQLATGRSKNEISSMMDNETYMSAKTAVKEGFATGMLYPPLPGEQVDPVLNFSRNLILNSATETMRKVAEFGKKLERAEPLNKLPLNQEPKIGNAGRTLSAENEQRITEARDLLNEVLSQIDTTEGQTSNSVSNSASTPPASATGQPISQGSPPPTNNQSNQPNTPEPTALAALAGGPDPPGAIPSGTTLPPDNLKILKAKLALELML